MLGNWCFVFGCNLYNKIGVGNDFTHPTNLDFNSSLILGKELESSMKKSDPVCQLVLDRCGNDPSAGSPTETLLRLHLPLNDKV
jgi:hypothetical protein